MVELTVLTGTQAGTIYAARRFPVRIGRDDAMEIHSEEPGIWKHHGTLDLIDHTIWLKPASNQTHVLVNGVTVGEVALKNGDVLDIGALKMRFGFAPTKQKSSKPREIMMWLGLFGLTLGQLGIIYWLLISVENDAFR